MTAALPGPVTFAFSQLRAETISWLWPGWLAAGAVALLDGDPGQGKSLLTLDLAAPGAMPTALRGHGSRWPFRVVLPQRLF